MESIIRIKEHHAEWYVNSRHTKKNKRIVDACMLINPDGIGGKYEIMFMDGEGQEFDCFQTHDWHEMQEAYSRMIRENCPESWKTLIADLEVAKAIAEAVSVHDGGTCNFDSPALTPPDGMKYEQVKACCAAVDVGCFDWKPFPKAPKMAVLSGCSGNGQGYRRTKGAEDACEYLKSKGYECGMYYQMD